MLSFFKKREKVYSDEELFSLLFDDQLPLNCNQAKSAENKEPYGLYHIGCIYYNKKEYKKSLAWFRKAAELGYPEAQYHMGYAYDRGLGVSKDYKIAMEWYLKAAKHNRKDAMCQIGYMYNYGQGMPRNYEIAMEWYLKSSALCHSQNNIAILYKHGHGVSRDMSTAMKWFTLAAEQENALAQYNLAFNFEFIKEVRDLQQAINWYKKAADNGFFIAKPHLFLMRLRGYYPQNNKQGQHSSVRTDENIKEKSKSVQEENSVDNDNHDENSPLLEKI